MVREKQHVFSARTTEEGLKALNRVRQERKIGWDELVIEAVSAHYELDKAMISLPRKEKPIKETQSSEQQAPTEVTSEELPAIAGEEKPAEEVPNRKRKKGSKAK